LVKPVKGKTAGESTNESRSEPVKSPGLDIMPMCKIFSDKLKSEFGHENGGTIDYKRASHDEFILRKSDYFPEYEVKECLKW
jgi:hypothetical protein